MTPHDVQKLQELEEKYEAFFPKLEELIISFAQVEAAYDDYRALRAFYGSEDWFHFRTQETGDSKQVSSVKINSMSSFVSIMTC